MCLYFNSIGQIEALNIESGKGQLLKLSLPYILNDFVRSYITITNSTVMELI